MEYAFDDFWLRLKKAFECETDIQLCEKLNIALTTIKKLKQRQSVFTILEHASNHYVHKNLSLDWLLYGIGNINADICAAIPSNLLKELGLVFAAISKEEEKALSDDITWTLKNMKVSSIISSMDLTTTQIDFWKALVRLGRYTDLWAITDDYKTFVYAPFYNLYKINIPNSIENCKEILLENIKNGLDELSNGEAKTFLNLFFQRFESITNRDAYLILLDKDNMLNQEDIINWWHQPWN